MNSKIIVINYNANAFTEFKANLVAAQMYDAVFLYARAVDKALVQGYSIDNGAALVELMADMSWTGFNFN